MRTDARFWDTIAAKYAKQPIKDVASYQLTMERTRAHLSADDHVLELGCGTGSTALLLADSVKHVTASDISAKMIEIGRTKAQNQKVDNVTFVQATPFDGALDGQAFDAVLAYNLLHLLEDTPAVIRRIRDLLPVGGLFISKTICLGEQSQLLGALISVMKAFGRAPYVKFLRIKELEQVITDEGFEIVEIACHPESRPKPFIVARKV